MGCEEWSQYCRGRLDGHDPKPDDIPNCPHLVFKEQGWVGIRDWLGTENLSLAMKRYGPFEEAREFAQGLGLKSWEEWRQYSAGRLDGYDPRPAHIPSTPNSVYKDQGWGNWGDWLGTGTVASQKKCYRPFLRARAFVRKLHLQTQKDWALYCKGQLKDHDPKPDDIPATPNRTYRNTGWAGIGDWLGTGAVAVTKREFQAFRRARAFARELGLKSWEEWRQYSTGRLDGYDPRPGDIPANPSSTYKDKGWVNWGDWLGTGTVATLQRQYLPFQEARKFAQTLGLKSWDEWRLYCRGELDDHDPKPDDIPAAPYLTYKDHGWIDMYDWLGKARPRKHK